MTIVPFPNKKTPQQIGRDFEIQWAARRRLDTTPGSGAGALYKLDVGGRGMLAELKHTVHRSFSVTAEIVNKMIAGARGPSGRQEMPILVVKMNGVDQPVWIMLESDALSILEGTSGVELKPSRMSEKRSAADPNAWLAEDTEVIENGVGQVIAEVNTRTDEVRYSSSDQSSQE